VSDLYSAKVSEENQGAYNTTYSWAFPGYEMSQNATIRSAITGPAVVTHNVKLT